PQRCPLQLPAAAPGSVRENTNSAVRNSRSSPPILRGDPIPPFTPTRFTQIEETGDPSEELAALRRQIISLQTERGRMAHTVLNVLKDLAAQSYGLEYGQRLLSAAVHDLEKHDQILLEARLAQARLETRGENEDTRPRNRHKEQTRTIGVSPTTERQDHDTFSGRATDGRPAGAK
ncbi:hypothetical protein, partial [Arthrobacter sp. CAN_A212]|uniref:hypothetical protein n=1 Tax=Arthrobacter sp. CAN_A212 TaxID=2787719 RepID=UPI002FEF8CD9